MTPEWVTAIAAIGTLALETIRWLIELWNDTRPRRGRHARR